MKTFRLALAQIWGYAKNERLTFSLFLIGTIISSFAFIYFYGNALVTRISASENSTDYRMFEVFFTNNEPIALEQLHVLDQYNISDVYVSCRIALSEEYQSKLPDNIPVSVIALLNNNEKLGADGVIRFFSDEELKEDVLIIDKAYINDIREFTINNHTFPVLRTMDNSGGGILAPIGTYMKYFGTANYVNIITANVLKKKDIQEATRILQETFPNSEGMATPDYYIQSDGEDETAELANVSLMYIVALLSFLFLFKYMLDRNSAESVIYYMVGANKPTVFKIMLLVSLLLSSLASLIAIGIHALFYNDFFSKLNMTETLITYSAWDYVVILAATVALSLISALPFIISSMKHTPMSLKAKYEW